MEKDRRKIAKLFFIIFSLSLVILLTVSVGHIAHSCFNEDCIICYEINLMRNIFDSLLILSLLFVLIKIFKDYIEIKGFYGGKYSFVPILVKVRLIE